MFGALSDLADAATNLTKAAVGVALTPVTMATDIVAMASGADDDEEDFHRTDKMLDNVAECVDKVFHPED